MKPEHERRSAGDRGGAGAEAAKLNAPRPDTAVAKQAQPRRSALPSTRYVGPGFVGAA